MQHDYRNLSLWLICDHWYPINACHPASRALWAFHGWVLGLLVLAWTEHRHWELRPAQLLVCFASTLHQRESLRGKSSSSSASSMCFTFPTDAFLSPSLQALLTQGNWWNE
ncbi:uncharacterized protein BJX67DRAFT_11632 [Aspergillus lucknowensis]|uniref:Uncharacterized protein n=1 Tax=Aspergillus lucknowensis TaxID=176173 RepID=A0ABR4M7G5_9EURO